MLQTKVTQMNTFQHNVSQFTLHQVGVCALEYWMTYCEQRKYNFHSYLKQQQVFTKWSWISFFWCYSWCALWKQTLLSVPRSHHLNEESDVLEMDKCSSLATKSHIVWLCWGENWWIDAKKESVSANNIYKEISDVASTLIQAFIFSFFIFEWKLTSNEMWKVKVYSEDWRVPVLAGKGTHCSDQCLRIL